MLLGFGDRQHVGMSLLPRRVGDLGDDDVEAAAVGFVAVVEADRIEAVAEVAQMGEQADRPFGNPADGLGHARTNGSLEWRGRIAEEVAATEFGKVATIDRPEPATLEDAVEFAEIEKQHGHAVAEGMRVR